jgi:hypothetical protein
MLKFSLGMLFFIVTVAGLGCAALANPIMLWAEVMVAVTILFLLAGLVAALVGHRRSRVFAIGFAVVGWVYFVLALTEIGLPDERLVTTRFVTWIYKIRMDARPGVSSPNPYGGPIAAEDPFGTPPELEDLFTDPPAAEDPFGDPPAEPSGSGYGYPPNPFGSPPATTDPYGSMQWSAYRAPSAMKDIGHSLWALVLACFGGMLAQFFRTPSRAAAPIG